MKGNSVHESCLLRELNRLDTTQSIRKARGGGSGEARSFDRVPHGERHAQYVCVHQLRASDRNVIVVPVSRHSVARIVF